MQLYTLGYLSGRADKKLSDLIIMGIPLVDVRYNPDSKRMQWWKSTLEEDTPGLVYYWIQDLGNVNYRAALTGNFTEADIRIKDIDAGIQKLASILDRHGKACLLCACCDKNRCHRSVVADEAVRRLDVRVTHI